MKITRISTITGIERTLDLDITQAQLDRYQLGGVLLQDAFPQLKPGEREFIKSGITEVEWNEVFAIQPTMSVKQMRMEALR